MTVASGSIRVWACIALWLGSTVAAAAPPETGQHARAQVTCAVRSTAAGLDVDCPSASMAELLGVLEQATGLRSEYPKELALVRVSVVLRRPSLLTVLESALSAFNFAVWMDDDSPSVTWLRIVEARSAVGSAGPPKAYQEGANEHPRTTPAPTTPIPTAGRPANEDAEMAEVRDGFADSVTLTPEVEPIPVLTSPVIMPDVDDMQ